MTGKPSLALDLPPEIISDIFVHCLPWTRPLQRGLHPFQNTRPQIKFDLHNAPLLLTRVCRRWRLIAEATPILWTRLPQSAKVLELYKMYIKNSGDTPLWAHLTFDNSGSGQHVAGLLAPHSHRWEHLTLTIGPRPDGLAIRNLPTQLSALKHLQLKQAHSEYPHSMRLDVYQLPKFVAPLLKSVAISSSDVLGLNLPWSQLTHYSGEFNFLRDAMAFLSLCTNLEVLHFHNPRRSAFIISRPMPSPLCLPHLHDLLLVDKRPNFDYHFLINRLTLPALETVGISAGRNLEALCRCVLRSFPGGVPRLRSIEVECPQGLGQPPNLRELSLAAPHIQELRLIRPSAEVILAMESHPANPLLFPNLRHLTLIEPFLKGFELVDIINSRCHPPPSSDLEPHTRLRRVEVMSVVVVGHTSMIQAVRRHGMVQPFHEEFQDVAECFTDDPNFKQMYERLKSILTVCEITPDSQNYQLPSHWGKLVDPLRCFFEFSESVFAFFENYEVYHPLLLSRYPVAPLLQEFLYGNLGSDGLLRTRHPEFLNRASALLDGWQPIIAEYSKKERWVVEIVDKAYSLVRKTDESAYRVVYCTAD